jgi:hypothetical protein
VQRGDFTFGDLLAWRYALRPLLAAPGVSFLDADEARNRVVLGIDPALTPEARQALVAAAVQRGVPSQALVLADSGPFVEFRGQPGVSVQSTFRPAPAGVEISFFPNFPNGFVCTLGFNAVLDGVAGFVTNDHCTNVKGGVEGTTYYQNLPPGPVIGTETVDPEFFTDDPCPSGYHCRFSDSAFVAYESASTGALGKIARTKGNGSLTVSPPALRFNIAGTSSALVGATLNKVGQTTGWTSGKVVATCADVSVSGTDPKLAQLCQTIVAAHSDHGDSGSPVFARVGNSASVRLVGILWGGATSNGQDVFVFSPFDSIQQELGTLRIH